VLTWTNTAAPPGTNTVTVQVTDNSAPPLTASASFTVTVLPLPSQLFLTNALFLTTTNASTNAVKKFAFTVNSAWTNLAWRVLATTNLTIPATNWRTILTNNLGGNLQVTDQLSTNFSRRFYRAVYP
jgi:hypothetical protein